MGFDNCTELERGQELTDFAAELNKDGDRVHFTFFVSGSNFIADASRNIYEGPHQRRGYSRISFGGTSEQVRKRVEYVNALYQDGHEIASHAVGHFNGAAWSFPEQWAPRLETGGCRQRPNRLSRPLSRQGSRAIPRAQGTRVPLRYQRCKPCRRLAGKDRRIVAVQFGQAENPRLGQGHVVDGLQFLRGPVACRLRSALLRDGARANAANLSPLFQEQL